MLTLMFATALAAAPAPAPMPMPCGSGCSPAAMAACPMMGTAHPASAQAPEREVARH